MDEHHIRIIHIMPPIALRKLKEVARNVGWPNHALAPGLTTDPMSLTMVRARQYNGVCVSLRERNHVLVCTAVFSSDQLVGATQEIISVMNVGGLFVHDDVGEIGERYKRF